MLLFLEVWLSFWSLSKVEFVNIHMPKKKNDFKDGIEIHFDEKRGYLELACEPDAFAAYREVARGHLKDLQEIPVDKVIEINIVDTATYVARRDAPKRRIWDLVIGVAVAIILTLAFVGACALKKRFFA